MKMLNFYKEAAKRFIALALAAGILGVPEGYEALHRSKTKPMKTYTFSALATDEGKDDDKSNFSKVTGTAVEDDELTQEATQTTAARAAGFEEYTTTSVTTIPSGPVAYVGDRILQMEAAQPWDEPELAEKVKKEENKKIDVTVPDKGNYSKAVGKLSTATPMEEGYYTLTVSTGMSPGTNVEYFVVRYIDKKGNPQSKYIFPKTHSLKATHDFITGLTTSSDAAKTQMDELEKKHSALENFDYSEETEPATKALASWTVDDFMFYAPKGLTKITSVEAFLSKGSWTVQGIEVSKVNSQTYYGEYGFYTGKYFLAMDRTRICELKKKKQGTLTLSAVSDTLINIGGSDSIYFELNTIFDDAHVDNPLDDLYSIRLDIADELKSGIETYLKNDPSDLSPAAKLNLEHIAVEIEYQDINGWTRNVTMPFLLSVLGQYEFYNVENLSMTNAEGGKVEGIGNVRSVGLCQRGDTVAFTACLPEFKSLISTKLYVGSKARERLKETGNIQLCPEKKIEDLEAELEEARSQSEQDDTKIDSIQNSIQSEKEKIGNYSDLMYQLDNDDIALSSISIYDGICVMGNTPDVTSNSKKWYSYTTGFAFKSEAPLYYSTTTKETGFVLNSGTADTFSMKAYNPDNPLIGYNMSGSFMVRIKTDNIVGAGTAGETYVKLSYQNSSGDIVTTRLYNVKDEVMNYLGYWPSDKSATSDYAYLHGVAENNIVEFPVQLDDVVAVTGIELSVDSYSGEEWQVDSVSVAVIDKIGRRYNFVDPDNVDLSANTIKDTEDINVEIPKDGDNVRLRSVFDDKYIAYDGEPSDGKKVYLDTSNIATFKLKSVGDGWYQFITSQDDKFCLNRQGENNSADDAAVCLFKNVETDNQKFKLKKNSDGTFTIIIGGTGERSCLDVGDIVNGKPGVIQNTIGGIPRMVASGSYDFQKWYVDIIHDSSYVPPAEGTASDTAADEETPAAQSYSEVKDGDIISFRNKNSGLYLAADQDSDNYNIIQAAAEDRTYYKVSKNGDFAAFQMMNGNKVSRNYIKAPSDRNAETAMARVPSNLMLFRIYDSEDGTFIIETSSGGFYLDVKDGATEAGANVETTHSSLNTDSQHWYIEINGVDVITPATAEARRKADEKVREEEEKARQAEIEARTVRKYETVDQINNGDILYFRNQQTDLYMSYSGKPSNRNNVFQAEQNEAAAFKAVELDNGWFQFVCVDDENFVLDRQASGGNKDGANIFLFTNNGNENQTFKVKTFTDGTFMFITGGTDEGSCVQAEKLVGVGDDINQGTVTGEREQRWYAEKMTSYVEEETEDPTNGGKLDPNAVVPYATNLNPYTADGDHSAYYVVREVVMTVIPPFPLKYKDEDSKSLIVAGQSVTFSSGRGRVIRSEDLNFDDVRYSMPYEYTSRDYGYTRTSKTFDLIVKVADDPTAGNVNGDSGSKNYFYFQLLFKYGGSALVLANQQLSSDGFRAGMGETFSISVNRDYGELTSIRILPEDVQEDSDIFDKLNIEMITVTERVYGDSSTQYVADNVGWIGIDYHDSAEDSSIQGRSGRTIGNISKTVGISYKQTVVNFLAEINTLPWDTDYLQVEGSIACDLEYIDIDGQPQTASFDVVKRMAEYMNKAPRVAEAASDGSNASLFTNMGCVSDPQWMLRPNHTDRFMLPSLPNAKSLSSITFYATSRNNKPGKWVIGSVSISRIIKDGGIVTLNSNGEYYRTMETRGFCENRKERKREELFLPAGTTQSLKLNFNENIIDWINYKTELSSVSRLPDSTNDELNIYIYPEDPERLNITNSAVKTAVQYTVPYSQVMQAKQSTLSVANSGTADAVFYTKGMSVPSMNNLVKMGIQCRDQYVLFDYAIVEQVRDGVVINTYHFKFHGESGLLGITKTPDDYTTVYEPMQQVVSLSLSEDSTEAALFATTDTNSKTSNIAIAMRYTSTLDPGNTEYYSPYIYLTDIGINKIYPGMMIDVPFDIPYVKDIKGYKIASFGNNVNAKVKGSMAVNYRNSSANDASGTMIGGVYSSNGSFDIKNALMEYDLAAGTTGEGSVAPLSIRFKTAKAMKGVESGTTTPVRATIYYTDQMGAAQTYQISDLRRFIQLTDTSPNAVTENDNDNTIANSTNNTWKFVREFETDSWKTVKLFLPECDEIKSIWVCPYGGRDVDAMWYLEQFSGTLGIDKSIKPYSTFDRLIDEELKESTAGTEIALYDVSMSTQLFANGVVTPSTNHFASATIESGDVAKITVKIRGGDRKYAVDTYEIVNGVKVKAPITFVSNKTDTEFWFTPDENETRETKSYQISVYSEDNKYVRDEIYVMVRPKPETTATTEIATTTTETAATTAETTTTTAEIMTTAETEAPPETTAPAETTTEAVTVPTEPDTEEKPEDTTEPEEQSE
ncbi:MAG: RICIN domain-containing protein [Ruminococcus sp.]|nr:RICIN domain-containing protein [Ruminococcus sp.]